MIVVIVILMAGVFGYSFYNYNRRKQSQGSVEHMNENTRLEKEVRDMVRQVVPNLENTVLVNGHFTKGTKLVLQTTTFYSYVILYNKEKHELQVISYNPETKQAADAGTFPFALVEPVTLDDYNMQTNYLFRNEDNKQLFSVQTVANLLPEDGEYQIQYTQINSYNELRNAFGLPPFQSNRS